MTLRSAASQIGNYQYPTYRSMEHKMYRKLERKTNRTCKYVTVNTAFPSLLYLNTFVYCLLYNYKIIVLNCESLRANILLYK